MVYLDWEVPMYALWVAYPKRTWFMSLRQVSAPLFIGTLYIRGEIGFAADVDCDSESGVIIDSTDNLYNKLCQP